MISWKDDDELLALMREHLYSAVLGDILDQMGYYHQFLPREIQPMRENMVLAGRAMTVLESDVEEIGQKIPGEKTFGRMLDALDDIRKNEVYLCSGASLDYALVGELMCLRMKTLGAAGTVMNGYHRDSLGILKLDFPCFSHGRYSQDQAPRGRVIDFRVPIQVGQAHVEPGDLVFGDLDGVLVIPQAIATEVIQRAYEKAMGERTVEAALRGGMSATESFAKYKIM